MDNQEKKTQYDIVINIIQVQKMYAEGRLTSNDAGSLMAAMIEQYAEEKVEQYIQKQNEISNTNEQA